MRKRGLLSPLITACLILLSGCAGVPTAELQRLGARADPAHIHFPTLLGDAERSQAAYSTEQEIRSRFPKVVRIAVPGNTDVLYFLERDDASKIQRITIRGTVDRTNRLEDIDITIRTDDRTQIPVHEGFDRVAATIHGDVRAHLKPGYATYLSGHSLGGAAAAVLAIRLLREGHVVRRVVTFGQPRFTTAEGVRMLGNLPLIRIVLDRDVVAMLPPSIASESGAGTYEHVGPEVILLDGSRFVYLDRHDATRLSLGEFWRSMSIANIDDHAMERYIAGVRAKEREAVQVPYNAR